MRHIAAGGGTPIAAGGFGSAVLELLGEIGTAPEVLRLGLPDDFIEQGSQEELRRLDGIDANGIADHIRACFSDSARQAKLP